MKPLRVFVSGTDTGVGKTWISARLLENAMGAGHFYLKPLQTGCEGGDDDGAWVSSQLPNLRVETLCRFGKPLAPLFAAEAEGVQIDPSLLLTRCREALRGKDSFVVEGAGGLLVPITEAWCMADLARELGFPVVLVARAGLGTINHTLLSLEAMEKRGLRVSAVILNPGPNAVDFPLFRQNREHLARHTRSKVFLWEDALGHALVKAIQEAD